MELIEENFEVELLEKEKMFVINWNRKDKVTPEEFITQFAGLDKAVKDDQLKLEELDEQKETIRKNLKKQISINQPKANKMSQVLSKAKVWADLNKKIKERAGKEEPNAAEPEGEAGKTA